MISSKSVTRYTKAVTAEYPVYRTYTYSIAYMYKRACLFVFDRFFFLPFSISFASLRRPFSSLFLSRSRLLYYFVTALCECLSFFPFLLFITFIFARPPRSPSSRFSLSFCHVSFLFSFLFVLFATNRTTRYPYFRLFDYLVRE